MSLAETGHPYANLITPINAYRGLRGGVSVERLAAVVSTFLCVRQWAQWQLQS